MKRVIYLILLAISFSKVTYSMENCSEYYEKYEELLALSEGTTERMQGVIKGAQNGAAYGPWGFGIGALAGFLADDQLNKSKRKYHKSEALKYLDKYKKCSARNKKIKKEKGLTEAHPHYSQYKKFATFADNSQDIVKGLQLGAHAGSDFGILGVGIGAVLGSAAVTAINSRPRQMGRFFAEEKLRKYKQCLAHNKKVIEENDKRLLEERLRRLEK